MEEIVKEIKEIEIQKAEELPIVDEVELFAHDRQTGYKAIVDRTTMNTICVVPFGHQIIQHQHVLREILSMKNYIIKTTRLLQKGRLLIIELTEREPKRIQLLPEDYIECGAVVTNDYKKTRGLFVRGTANRLVCENGMISPSIRERCQIFAYGTEEFSKEIENSINESIDAWASETIYSRAASTVVNVKDILENHSFLPKKYMEIVVSRLENRDNLYNIYNKYTEVITHSIAPKAQKDYVLYLQKRANQILMVEVPPV